MRADRTAWRICRDNRWWSVFGKKRGRGRKAGPPVHDDRVSRDFRIAVVTWIERTYHQRRRQAALGRLTAVECATVMTTLALQAA